MRKRFLPGLVLVEVLLAATILGVILIPTLNLLVTGVETSWFVSRETRAMGLAREGWEALRSIKERNWAELKNGSFYPMINGGVWELEESEEGETIGPYTRWVEIGPVYRDEFGQIVETGGTLDPSTKAVNLKVSWFTLRPRTLSFSSYLTRYLDNLVWRQTTKGEFDLGEKDATKTLDPPLDDGEVVLEGGCASGTPEALIYDDELENGWRLNCQGFNCGFDFGCWLNYWFCLTLQFLNNAEVDLVSTDYTWDESPMSVKVTLKPTGWSWVRFYNFDGVCTQGFRHLHFYAYNPSADPINFYVTAIYDEWETTEVTIPSQEWTEVTLDYDELEEYRNSFVSLYFHKWMESGAPDLVFYLDQLELTGGVGGYFTSGSLSSSVFDAGRETVFNQVSFDAQIPPETGLGLQIATSGQSDGPWVFYGPGGTSSDADLYTDSQGEGIWLGNNLGRFVRYKAYLFSHDGESTPTLEEVRVNYVP